MYGRRLVLIIGRRAETCRRFSALQASPAAAKAQETAATEVPLYRSTVDIAAPLVAAHQKCWLGVGLGAMGFLGVLTSAGPTATTAHFVLILAGAAANGYSQLVVKPERMKTLAMRHVEELTVMRPIEPTPELLEKGSAEEVNEAASPESAETAEVEDSADKHWIESATELRLKIRCANLDREVLLTQPAAPWEGSRFAGLVADDRVPFSDLCQNSRLLHIDTETGESLEPAALEALLSTSKGVSQESIGLRESVTTGLRLSAKHAQLMEAKLAEVRPKDVERLSKLPPQMRESPVKQIEGIGQRAFSMGVAILGASVLFQFRPHASDPEKDFRLRYLFFSEPPNLRRNQEPPAA